MAIVLRTEKGEPLTNEELDNNFVELRDNKVDKALLTNNNTIFVKNNAGELVAVQVATGRILGRLPGGEIKGLTQAEILSHFEFGGGGTGVDGKTVLNGNENPTEGDGGDGDFYINKTTWQIF